MRRHATYVGDMQGAVDRIFTENIIMMIQKFCLGTIHPGVPRINMGQNAVLREHLEPAQVRNDIGEFLF